MTENDESNSTIEVPGFEILKTLGQGGMATVYLARQENLGRKVALKVLDPGLAANPAFAQRFLKEGRVIAQLVHPHIITVHDIGKAAGSYFIAMEYLRGGDLKEKIAGGLDQEQALRILGQVASALALAHRRGVIHRDIKPANILFRDELSAVVSDFGIAKVDSVDGERTATGWVVGTPYYMSPEQALGRPVTARSDLYSLGVVLYQMLTGRRPFSKEEAQTPRDRGGAVPQLPEPFAGLQVLIDGLLAYDPPRRFTAEQLLAALDALAHGGEVIPPGEEVTAVSGEEETLLSGSGQAGLAGSPQDEDDEGLLHVSVSEQDLEVLPASGQTEETVPPYWARRGWLWGAVAALGLALVLVLGYEIVAPPGPTPQDRELSPVVREKIQRLLDAAEAHQMVHRYTAPPGSNAMEAYQDVLKLDPDNARARAGLEALKDLDSTGL